MAHFHLLASRQDKVGESFKHKKIIIFMINCVIFELFNHPKVFLFIIISILPPGERPPRGRLSPEPALPHNHLCNRLHPSYRPILPGQYQESRQPPSSKMIFVLIPAIIIHCAMGRTRVAVSSSFPSARSSRAHDFSHIELLPVDTESSAY